MQFFEEIADKRLWLDVLDIVFFGLCSLYVYDQCAAFQQSNAVDLIPVGFVSAWIGMRLFAAAEALFRTWSKGRETGDDRSR
jgi:hypothetical protein